MEKKKQGEGVESVFSEATFPPSLWGKQKRKYFPVEQYNRRCDATQDGDPLRYNTKCIGWTVLYIRILTVRSKSNRSNAIASWYSKKLPQHSKTSTTTTVFGCCVVQICCSIPFYCSCPPGVTQKIRFRNARESTCTSHWVKAKAEWITLENHSLSKHNWLSCCRFLGILYVFSVGSHIFYL